MTDDVCESGEVATGAGGVVSERFALGGFTGGNGLNNTRGFGFGAVGHAVRQMIIGSKQAVFQKRNTRSILRKTRSDSSRNNAVEQEITETTEAQE
jgi:hypothetical protein